ncbi:hypothetical protein NF557_09310 [Ornithinimicrobium cryptoxanthini]|uniref:Radical SAM core domain-containing protein n=2 Tax=Ornithinimicrobium cryptoxanthini TaxID=2934161 RepID=A0ABY4YMX3_9MICO|nr:hypothetical protein NF557_09310 [Ornithinimicrobium cryptoxanthini]
MRRGVMSWDVLGDCIRKLRNEELLGEGLTVSWHGAEPLMAGLDWYEQAFQLIEDELSASTRVEHVFQTNGVLLSDDWCRFLTRTGAHIGVSLDGPETHSGSRVNWAGRPAWRQAMAGVDRLNQHGVTWSLLTVVTPETMRSPEQFVDFVLGTGCSALGFKVENTLAAHESRLESSVETLRLYRDFVKHLWTALPRDGVIRVREFDQYLALRDTGAQAIPVTIVPLRNLTVAVNGDYTVFAPELLYRDDRAFVFGNVTDDAPLLDCLVSPLFEAVSREILAGVARCAGECDYYRRCGSYYVSHKFSETGSFDVGETAACRLELQTLFGELDTLTGHR